MGFFDGRLDSINLDSFDTAAFADELLAGAEVSDAEREAVRSVFGKTSGKLKNAVALRSAAQSALDKARNVVTEAERVRDENFVWARDNRAALAELANPNHARTVVAGPHGEALTAADVTKLLNTTVETLKTEFGTRLTEQDNAYVGLLADTMELSNKWHRLFPDEDFDYSAIQQHALGKHMPLRLAFDDYIKPKLEAKHKADIERIKLEEYERGVVEGRSQREADPSLAEEGGEVGSALRNVLLGRNTQKLTDGEGNAITGEDAFVRRWNKTGGFTKAEATH